MKVDGRNTRSIWVEPDGLTVGVIDQTRLPHQFATVQLASLAEAAHAIRSMQIRGAPLIGATAAYGMALAMKADASDEAIEHANSTRFGLGCNVYTRDLQTIFRCMREIKAGTVWFNDPLTDNDAGPFGGFKQSGFGRELGQEGLEAFHETKHVHLETRIAPKEWWYPYGGGAQQAVGA